MRAVRKLTVVGVVVAGIATNAGTPLRAALFAPQFLPPAAPEELSRQQNYSFPTDDQPRQSPVPQNRSCENPAAPETLLRKYRRAIQRYSRGKMRVMLEQHFRRAKDGETLGGYFPDYRDHPLFVRLTPGVDTPVTDHTLQKDFYIFKEGDRIVMAPDIMWMAEDAKRQVLREIVEAARPSWSFDAYKREAQKTMEVAARRPFRLDCNHVSDLDGLISHSLEEMRRSDDSRVISPLRFGSLLTILRGYITFNYYKSLTHSEFEQHFQEMVKHLGNQSWAHQKLTRLLGLHVMGRIESNAGFRRTYEAAISNAARKHPHVPRKWIEQIIWIESRGDPKSISRAGAYGLMQLMPLVYLGMGAEKAAQYPLAFERTVNPFDPSGNIERGAAFLDKLQKRMMPTIIRYSPETRRQMIFHAYNGGVTRVLDLVRKHGSAYVSHLPDETKAYLSRLDDFPHDVSRLLGQ